MQKKIDLTGKIFGDWFVIKKDLATPSNWFCSCLCGCNTIRSVYGPDLRRGQSRGCGRRRHFKGITKNTNPRLYRIWKAMKQRCYNIDNSSYKNYGGRGITVCDEWRNSYLSFYNWACFNGYESSLTIERIDNNGNYEPENCRWATHKEQSNNKRSNHLITIGNRTQTVSKWSDETGIPKGTILKRSLLDIPSEKIISKEPLVKRGIKLKEIDVVQIRNMHDSTDLSYSQIAQIYGVSKSTIEYIVQQKTWRHVK